MLFADCGYDAGLLFAHIRLGRLVVDVEWDPRENLYRPHLLREAGELSILGGCLGLRAVISLRKTTKKRTESKRYNRREGRVQHDGSQGQAVRGAI